MRKIQFLLQIFSMVTTCVVFAVALFTTVVNPVDLLEPVIFWQIPAVSMLCTFGSLIYPWNRVMGKKEKLIRIMVHYLYVNFVVLGAGVIFDWYSFNLISIMVMLITIAIIYALVSIISWTKKAREAKRINQKLKEYQEERLREFDE